MKNEKLIIGGVVLALLFLKSRSGVASQGETTPQTAQTALKTTPEEISTIAPQMAHFGLKKDEAIRVFSTVERLRQDYGLNIEVRESGFDVLTPYDSATANKRKQKYMSQGFGYAAPYDDILRQLRATRTIPYA